MRNQRHWTPPDYAVRCSIFVAQTPHSGECTAAGKTATLTFGTDLALREAFRAAVECEHRSMANMVEELVSRLLREKQ